MFSDYIPCATSKSHRSSRAARLSADWTGFSPCFMREEGAIPPHRSTQAEHAVSVSLGVVEPPEEQRVHRQPVLRQQHTAVGAQSSAGECGQLLDVRQQAVERQCQIRQGQLHPVWSLLLLGEAEMRGEGQAIQFGQAIRYSSLPKPHPRHRARAHGTVKSTRGSSTAPSDMLPLGVGEVGQIRVEWMAAPPVFLCLGRWRGRGKRSAPIARHATQQLRHTIQVLKLTSTLNWTSLVPSRPKGSEARRACPQFPRSPSDSSSTSLIRSTGASSPVNSLN